MTKRITVGQALAMLLAAWASSVFATDSDMAGLTLRGLQGVTVVVEDLQPGLTRYGQRAGLEKERIKTDAELILKKGGIPVLSHDEWLKAPGKPFLYIVINTHEYQKYWYAYDVRIELKQRVLPERNTSVAAMASTWSVSMTGNTHIGKLGDMKTNLTVLLERFIAARRRADSAGSGKKG